MTEQEQFDFVDEPIPEIIENTVKKTAVTEGADEWNKLKVTHQELQIAQAALKELGERFVFASQKSKEGSEFYNDLAHFCEENIANIEQIGQHINSVQYKMYKEFNGYNLLIENRKRATAKKDEMGHRVINEQATTVIAPAVEKEAKTSILERARAALGKK